MRKLLFLIGILTFFLSSCGSTLEVTVIFDTNGGSEVPSQVFNEESVFTLPTDPTKENFVFNGWFLDQELKTPFSVEGILSLEPKDAITVYAKWVYDPEIVGTSPVYQGMDVASVNNTQASLPLSFRSYRETIVTSGINDEIPTIDLPEQPDFTYYANPNEEILVRVYLTNPDSQVILRFKLNGVIYQSFEFQEGSNSELLIVRVNAGSISGIKELTIDEIKYVENVSNIIKDAEFEGDRTIQMGVTYQYPLEAVVSNEVITATSYQSTITISDTDDLISLYENPPVFYLFDGTSIVYTQVLNVGSNTIEYQQLKTDQSFEYAIAMTYDLLDGEGVNAYIALQNVKRTEKIIEIASVTRTQTSLTFELTINDQENVGSLTAIELYQGETLVESLTDLTLRTFENLLSNNSYEIKVTYTYDLNDGVGAQLYNVRETSTTLTKATPSVEITDITTTQESVSFELNITDTDSVGEVTAIELYQGETLVESLTDLTLRTFENLLSNNSYEIKVTYTYDLNDGVGEQVLVKTETVTMLAKATPEVVVDNIVPTQDSISFEITVTDTDEVGAITAIELYQGEVFVESLNDLSVRTFTNLLSNTEYQIKVTYTYDLNDGFGERELLIDRINYLSVVESLIENTDHYIMLNDTFYAILFREGITYSQATNMAETYGGHLVTITSEEELDIIKSIMPSSTTLVWIGAEINSNNEPEWVTGETFEYENWRDFEPVFNIGDTINLRTYEFDWILSSPGNTSGGLIIEVEDVTKIYTLPKSSPEVFINNVVPTQDSLTFELTVIDPDGVGEVTAIELYQGETLVESLTDLTLRTFENLLSNNSYEIKVTYTYDLNDGVGEHLLDIDSDGTLYIDGIYQFNKEAYKDSVGLLIDENKLYVIYTGRDISWDDAVELSTQKGGHLITINSDEELLIAQQLIDKTENFNSWYGGIYENGEWKWITGETFDFITDHFYYRSTIDPNEGQVLKSWFDSSKYWYINRDYGGLIAYIVEIDYGNERNDKKIVTLTKATPSVEITDITTTQESVSFELNITDTDSVGEVTAIELYQGETLVESLTDLTLRTFENLLSNNSYEIKVIYNYDINEGNGIEQIILTQSQKTLAKSMPIVSLNNINTTNNNVTFAYTETDLDGVGELVSIELYEGETLVESLLDLSLRVFDNLTFNTAYEIKVTYEYNINDGNGTITIVEYYDAITEGYYLSFVTNLTGVTINRVMLIREKDFELPSNLEKEGYSLEGWYFEGYEELFDLSVPLTQDTTIYAKWVVNQYTINFNENGGSEVTSITQDYATEVTAPEDPTKSGYTFNGWYSDIARTRAYVFTTIPSTNVELYAKWTFNQAYDVYGISDALLESTGTLVTLEGYVTSNIDTNIYFIQDDTGAMSIDATNASDDLRMILQDAWSKGYAIEIQGLRNVVNGLELIDTIEFINTKDNIGFTKPIPITYDGITDISEYISKEIVLYNIKVISQEIDQNNNMILIVEFENETKEVIMNHNIIQIYSDYPSFETGTEISIIVSVYFKDQTIFFIDKVYDYNPNRISIEKALLEAPDTTVILVGYVTMNIDGNNFLFQDNTGALDVFLGSGASAEKDAVLAAYLGGYAIEIQATRGAFRGLEQVSSIEYVIIVYYPGFNFPTAVDVTDKDVTALDDYIAQLVEFKGLEVVSIAYDNFGNLDINVTNGTASFAIRWDSRTGDPVGLPTELVAGDVINVVAGAYWSAGLRLRISSADAVEKVN